MIRDHSQHRFSLTTAICGTLLVFGYALLAVFQILWLNPLAAAPGMQLNQIWEDVAAANESMHASVVIGIMAIGPLVAILVLVTVALRPNIVPLVIVVVYLLILIHGAIAYFWASFGPGMSLADTYGISGGDHSPWAIPLYLTSAAALVSLLGIGVLGIIQNTRRHSTSGT